MDLVRPPERLRRIAGERAPCVDEVVIVLLHAREAVQHGVKAIDGVLNDRESVRVVIMCEIERWLQPGALEEDPNSVRYRIIVTMAEYRRDRSIEIAKHEQLLICRLDRIDGSLDPIRQTPAEI